MDLERVMRHFAALHAIPEPGFAEVKTSAYLAEALKTAGYAETTGIGGSGVVGVLNGGKPGKTVMVRADMAFDLRARDNGVMEELIETVKRSIEAGAATVGAKATVTVKGGVPAAEYDLGLVKVAREAIARVLGANGVLDPIVSPGGEDFHFFAKKIPGLRAAYIGLGCDLTPGLHHPEMKFNTAALPDGVSILYEMLQGVWVE